MSPAAAYLPALCFLLLGSSGNAAASPRRRTVELFLWGYGPGPLVPDSIWELIAPNKNKTSSANFAHDPTSPCKCSMNAPVGCFADFDNANHTRVLRHEMGSGSYPTQESCAEACAQRGFSLVGLEYGGQCYCDSALNPSYPPSGPIQKPLSECNMTCAGNSSQSCGSANREIIFKPSCTGNCFDPRPIATGIIGGCGHQVTQNGTWIIPNTTSYMWLAGQVAKVHAANLTFVPLIAGCTLDDLRALVFNQTAVDTFVAALAADAAHNDYDGFNFDLEMGGFGAKEEDAFAELLVKLQPALGPTKVASACVGNTKNGVVSPEGVQKAPAGGARLVDMGLYISSDKEWKDELRAALLRIKAKHLTIGLSSSKTSWKSPPTAAQVQLRFEAMKAWGVDAIAMFGSQWLASYEGALRGFIAGE